MSETPPSIEIITEGGDVMAGDPAAVLGEEGAMGVRIFQGDDLDYPDGIPLPPAPPAGEPQEVRKILPGALPNRDKPPI